MSIESKRKMSGSDTDAGMKRMKKEESDDDYDSSHTMTNKSDGVSIFTLVDNRYGSKTQRKLH